MVSDDCVVIAFVLRIFLICLAGCLKLEVTPSPETVMPCLSPELIPIKPASDKNVRPIKEVLEFPSSDVYVPHSIYRSVHTYIPPK